MELAALGISGISVFCKELLYHYNLRVGKKANSASVIANAWMHRSDALVSTGVFAGIAGAMMGYPVLDPLAAIVVSGVILRQGILTTKEAVEDLRDAPASMEELEPLKSLCYQIPEIKDIPKFQARKSGPYLFVECMVTVRDNISASAAHRIAKLIKLKLIKFENGKVANVHVSVKPIGVSGVGEKLPLLFQDENNITNTITELLNKYYNGNVSIHNIYSYYKDDGTLKLEIYVMDSNIHAIEEKEKVNEIYNNMKKQLCLQLHDHNIDANVFFLVDKK